VDRVWKALPNRRQGPQGRDPAPLTSRPSAVTQVPRSSELVSSDDTWKWPTRIATPPPSRRRLRRAVDSARTIGTTSAAPRESRVRRASGCVCSEARSSELYRTLSLVEYVVGAQERACMRAPRPRRFLSDALVRPGDARESRACPFDSLPEKTPCLFVTPLSPLASGGWK